METIRGKGHWVALISALASGDAEAALSCKVSLQDVVRLLESNDVANFSRRSRKGWSTMDHPNLGTLQWKSGVDFRTVGKFFFLRLNGEVLITAFPKTGLGATLPEWVAKAAHNRKGDVENHLGILKWH